MKTILKFKKLLLAGFGMVAIVFCFAFVITACIAGKREAFPLVSKYHTAPAEQNPKLVSTKKAVLKTMTLNIAHGRKDGMSQIFQSTEKIKSNLNEIIALLRRETPDLLAVQEADGPSAWSGNFNHVSYIAEKSGYTYSVRGAHVDGIMLSYGTALLSKYPFIKPVSVTFRPSPPTFPKGFVSASIRLPDESEVEIVSVHLDFSRKSVRERQVHDIIEKIGFNKKPLIIMGDFNCEWEEKSAVGMLAEQLELSAYHADNSNHMITFPCLMKRLDWILISKEFEFGKYDVITDVVSDHFGVISEISRKS